MKKKLRSQNEVVDDLVKITATILSVYDRLIQNRVDKNKEQYQSTLDDLKLCLELEDKLYKELNSTSHDSYQVYEEVSKYLERKEILEKELILERIELYLCNYYFLNPFLSMREDKEYELSENTIAILSQYIMDFLRLKTYLMELLIVELDMELLKEGFITILYEDIFQCKAVEWELISSEVVKNPELKGRERCILFGQNEELIEKLYFKKSDLLFWNMVGEYLFEKNHQDFVNKNAILISIFAALYLLDYDCLEKIYFDFCKKYYIDSLGDFDRRLEDVVSIFDKLRGMKKEKVRSKSI